jgi:hypothetical protein
MRAAVTLQPLTRTYLTGDRALPGISSRLRLAGLVDETWFARYPNASLRGTAVHSATQFWDEGDLAIDSVDPAIVGYLDAWKRFVAETGWRNLEPPETMVASLTMDYATTIDRVGGMGGEWVTGLDVPVNLTVLNLKSGRSAPWHAVQLAGEALAYSEWAPFPLFKIQRAALHLLADGTYRLEPYRNREDYDDFRAVLRVARWRERHG